MNFDANNNGPETRADLPQEEASGWDPYVASMANKDKETQKERLSESMSVVLDELGDTTVSRRATLLRMHRKD